MKFKRKVMVCVDPEPLGAVCVCVKKLCYQHFLCGTAFKSKIVMDVCIIPQGNKMVSR